MKAIIHKNYGSPKSLLLEEVPRPTPKANEVLVKIQAATINDWDWSLIRGKPYIYRLIFGLSKPKFKTPGIELAGTIETVGTDVKTLTVGQEVYGDTSEFNWGTLAEYMCVNEKSVVEKPKSMSFEEAAAISHASMLAYQGLVDIGNIQKGQDILINGAGGGMGTFGLQIAKEYAGSITGVDSGDKLELLQSLGFDQLIDYTEQDFTRLDQKYDLILDAKTTRNPSAFARVLKPGGTYVSVGGYLSKIAALMFSRMFGRKNFHMLGLKPNKDLQTINKLYEEGKIKPIIDGPYKLAEVPGLIEYFGRGEHKGKIVISI